MTSPAMQVAVEQQRPARARVGGRTLWTLRLEADREVEAGFAEAPRGSSHLLLLLQGSLAVDGAEILPGGWALLLSPRGRAGAGGCLLAVLSWDGVPPAGAQVCPRPPLDWYGKYEASLAPLEPAGDGDLGQPGNRLAPLAPWSGYWVEIPPGDGTAAVHVHHDLVNVIAVAGEGDGTAGHLLVEDGAGVHAWPLVPGDLAVVETEVVHNLVPLAGGLPLCFFVFNDSVSHYQDTASSDYHNLARVDLGSVTREARDGEGPACFHVRAAGRG